MKLDNWERPYFEKPLFEPFVFYYLFGAFDQVDFNIYPDIYKTNGLPETVDLYHKHDLSPLSPIESYKEGYLWDLLQKSNPSLYAEVADANERMAFQGILQDTTHLNELRDVLGIVQYMLDKGGLCVFDPQMMKIWTKEEWRDQVFLPTDIKVSKHVVILTSAEEDGQGTWFHTRGMRKYGRPDLSMHRVLPEEQQNAVNWLTELIKYQALGGIIDDGQQLMGKTLSGGMRFENKGSFEDEDFNNKHIEIHWG